MVDAWWAKDALWPIPVLLPLVLAAPLTPLLVGFALKGRHRAGVLFTWTALTVVYGLVGALGVYARLSGQPGYVWVVLFYPGLDPALALGLTLPVARWAYKCAELRKSVALDI